MYLSTPRMSLSTFLNYTLQNVLINTCTQVQMYLSTVLKYKLLKYRPSMITIRVLPYFFLYIIPKILRVSDICLLNSSTELY